MSYKKEIVQFELDYKGKIDKTEIKYFPEKNLKRYIFHVGKDRHIYDDVFETANKNLVRFEYEGKIYMEEILVDEEFGGGKKVKMGQRYISINLINII